MRLRVIFLCSLGLLPIFGCEKRIPKDELGTVVFEVPAVGDDKPPPLPALDEGKDQAKDSSAKPRK